MERFSSPKIQVYNLLIFVLLSLFPIKIDAQNSSSRPEELGSFIKNCSLFITWPGTNDASFKLKPLIIGVFGSVEDSKTLSLSLEKESINDKKIIIKNIASINEIDECNILFISKNAENKLTEIVNYTKNKAILTVAKTRGFCEQGVHINLVSFSAPVVFEVNQNAIFAAGLKVSHILMSHAQIISR